MKRRERYQNGSIRLDPRDNTWHFRWRENGKRPSRVLGTLKELPTRSAAMRAAEVYRLSGYPHREDNHHVVTFEAAARRYVLERMPQRYVTKGGYRNNLEKHVIPQWGAIDLGGIKPLAVDRWLSALPLAQKTKSHIRSVMRQVFEYAMLCETFEVQRNPMDLVRIAGATLRDKEPLILTPEQFGALLGCLVAEPARTMVIVAMCLGLRRSELGGLKWSDFDWHKQEVLISRGVIAGRVDDVKTKKSRARLPLDPALISVLESWRAITEFKAESDWVWASPWQAGERPYSLNVVQCDHIIPAGKRCGLGKIGWHTFRHTYRAWMGSSGTPLGTQQALMRHASISTTMNTYGAGMPDAMPEANSSVVRMVIQ